MYQQTGSFLLKMFESFIAVLLGVYRLLCVGICIPQAIPGFLSSSILPLPIEYLSYLCHCLCASSTSVHFSSLTCFGLSTQPRKVMSSLFLPSVCPFSFSNFESFSCFINGHQQYCFWYFRKQKKCVVASHPFSQSFQVLFEQIYHLHRLQHVFQSS